MQSLLRVSVAIDRLLSAVASLAAWAGLALVAVVVYDVVTRYFGFPRILGFNATQLQESEYWLHTILFSFVIGAAYIAQAHVRIDLVRDRMSTRAKYAIEALGCILFLIPFSATALWFQLRYAMVSYAENEISKSVIGLTNIWVLKSFLAALFVLLLLAGISQFIKAIAGLTGRLPENMARQTLGGDL